MQSGRSIADALPASTLANEYAQIERRFGRRERDWRFVSHRNVTNGTRHYDVVSVLPASATVPVDVWFDITSFFGRWPDMPGGKILQGVEMQQDAIAAAGAVAGSASGIPTWAWVAGAAVVTGWLWTRGEHANPCCSACAAAR